MVWFDRILSILLILAGIVHAFGSLRYYHDDLTLLWSLCASLFIILIGAISLLRASRPRDSALAWICLVSALTWIAAALRFGYVVGKPHSSHVLIVVIVTLGMCVFSVRTLLTARK